MNCLSWWLPLFILPLPVCPPELFALFVLGYWWKLMPCAYCTVVLVGLFFATSYWTYLSPWTPTDDASRLLFLTLPGLRSGIELDLGFSWRGAG